MAYQSAMENYEVWFCHSMTSVILLTESVGPESPHHYHKRGWCNLESMLCRLLKTRRADLWDPVVDVGNPSNRHLQPPMSLEAFKELIDFSYFPNPSDGSLVLRLYGRALHRALGGAEVLRYDHARWGDIEMETLAACLPLCASLKVLHLKRNLFQATGFITFSKALGRGALSNLRELDLSNNDQVNDWRGALLSLADAVSPRVPGASAGLPRLQELCMQDCKFGHESFFYFCRALMEGSLVKLQRLNVDGNGVANSGIDPIVAALERGALPSLQMVMGVPDEGAQTFRDVLLHLQHLRRLSGRIDTKQDDASRRSGTAAKLSFSGDEVNKIDKRIKVAREHLDRSRRANVPPLALKLAPAGNREQPRPQGMTSSRMTIRPVQF